MRDEPGTGEQVAAFVQLAERLEAVASQAGHDTVEELVRQVATAVAHDLPRRDRHDRLAANLDVYDGSLDAAELIASGDGLMLVVAAANLVAAARRVLGLIEDDGPFEGWVSAIRGPVATVERSAG